MAWIEIGGSTPHTDDRWINSDHVLDIQWNSREQRLDLWMSDQREVQVAEAGGIEQIQGMVGSPPHEPHPLHG